MTDTNPENVPAPPPFVQPQLVKCTIDECKTLVSIFAKACPACANPDPARYHKSRDPQERTLARWQYDHSPAVVAWNKAQGELQARREAEAARQKPILEAQARRRELEAYDNKENLRKQYEIGIKCLGLGCWGMIISAACTYVSINAHRGDGVGWFLIMLFVSSVAMYQGRKLCKSAEAGGYHPPSTETNPG